MGRGNRIRAIGLRVAAVLLVAMVGFAVVVGVAPARAADTVRLVATELAPYATLRDGKLGGAMVEIVSEMARRVGHSGAMDYVPWTRAQAMGRDEADVALVVLVRSPEREGNYRWIAHAFDDESVFVTRAGEQPVVTTVEQARSHRVAVIRNSSSEAFLKERRIVDLDVSETAEINARKLLTHRVDVWFGNRMMVVQALRNIGSDLGQVVLGPPLKPVSVYFGGNRAISDAEAARWADALAAMRRDGSFERIMARYR